MMLTGKGLGQVKVLNVNQQVVSRIKILNVRVNIRCLALSTKR